MAEYPPPSRACCGERHLGSECTDDLVQRLRKEARQDWRGNGPPSHAALCGEAADEIERLRDSYWARMEATGRRPRIADYEGEIRRLREGIRRHDKDYAGGICVPVMGDNK